MRLSFQAVRVKFIDAMLTTHGVFNKAHITSTFDVSYPCASRDVAEYRNATPGVWFDARSLSFKTDEHYVPMINSEEYLKAISLVFDAPDYSVPGSVSVSRNVAISETQEGK